MHFLKAIRKTFVVEEVTDDPDRESYSRENIYLYVESNNVPDFLH